MGERNRTGQPIEECHKSQEQHARLQIISSGLLVAMPVRLHTSYLSCLKLRN